MSSTPTSAPLKIAIGIATAGRREILADTLAFLGGQLRAADELLICPARPEDVDHERLARYPGPLRLVEGPTGSSHQRNALMRAAPAADVMVFFDDDFLPAPDYLLRVEDLFRTRPDVAAATGELIADGAQGPGFSYDEGCRLLKQGLRTPPGAPDIREVFNGYGCNFAVRMAPVHRHGLRFDEALPLYAWLEDVDFSRQLAAHGRIVKAPLLRGVHLGTKRAGRSPGRRLGYSQVANRVYLARKRSLSWPQAWDGMVRNLAANLMHSVRPEPWADRRGRLAGNALAFGDWLRGRLHPGRIMEMK